MADDKVITGAIGIIKDSSGTVIGKMKTITVSESIQRGQVRGIGSIVPSELPALSWGAGTLRCSFFNIDFKKSSIPGAINRDNTDVNQFTDDVTLQEDGITVQIYKKVSDVIDPTTKHIKSKEVPYATVSGLFIDTESFDISEGQISGRDQSFMYMNPITFGK